MTKGMSGIVSKSSGSFPDVSTVRRITISHLLIAFSLNSDVQQNIRTLLSLLNTAEEKYAAAQVLSKPEVRNEEGLPLTEIYEELDEEGNVICKTSILSRLFCR